MSTLIPGDRLLRLTTFAMVVTDVGFILYWALIAAGVLPAEVMFEDYADPQVSAWNWSFLPLDLAASLTGLLAVRALRRGAPAGPALALSLGLTATAGGLAVAYWVQLGQLDPGWLLPNLALLLFPLPLLARLVRTGAPTQPEYSGGAKTTYTRRSAVTSSNRCGTPAGT